MHACIIRLCDWGSGTFAGPEAQFLFYGTFNLFFFLLRKRCWQLQGGLQLMLLVFGIAE